MSVRSRDPKLLAAGLVYIRPTGFRFTNATTIKSHCSVKTVVSEQFVVVLNSIRRIRFNSHNQSLAHTSHNPTNPVVQLGEPLLRIKDQAPDLNRLSMRSLWRRTSIKERRVGCQPCSVNLRIIALDQSDLLGCLIREVVPPMVGVEIHAVRSYNKLCISRPFMVVPPKSNNAPPTLSG